MNNSISIIIPAYNDARTIRSLLDEAVSVVKKITDDYEIIVTDDGSSDNTADIVKSAAAENSRILLRRHEKNMGFGITIKEMYGCASKDLVFSCPGDGQIAVDQIFKMLPALNGNDLIIGWRVKRMDNFKRNVQTNTYNFLLRTLYGLYTHDVNSVKLFKKKNIMSGIELESDSPFVDAEICIKAIYRGLKVKEVPIEHRRRTHYGASGGKLKIIMPTVMDLITKYPRFMKFRRENKS